MLRKQVLVESFKTGAPTLDKFLLKLLPKIMCVCVLKVLKECVCFRKLSVSRMGTSLDSKERISNCSNKSHYAYSYEEIKK